MNKAGSPPAVGMLYEDQSLLETVYTIRDPIGFENGRHLRCAVVGQRDRLAVRQNF